MALDGNEEQHASTAPIQSSNAGAEAPAQTTPVIPVQADEPLEV